MINEEIMDDAGRFAKETITIAIKIANKNLNEKNIKSKMELLLNTAEDGLKNLVNGNEIKLKDLYKKGQLSEINVDKTELKDIKKELNRNAVNFSVMKDRQKGEYTLFFQAKDSNVIKLAFKQVLLKEKIIQKPSLLKEIKNYKQHTQSLQGKKQKESEKDKSIKIPRKDKNLER